MRRAACGTMDPPGIVSLVLHAPRYVAARVRLASVYSYRTIAITSFLSHILFVQLLIFGFNNSSCPILWLLRNCHLRAVLLRIR